MVTAISRAGFLGRRFNAEDSAIRPPWATPEAYFTEHCSRDMACAEACPEKIIFKGRSGFPEISFSGGECTFCAACVTACTADVLGPLLARDGSRRRPWNLRLNISDNCLSAKGVVCRVCPETCDARAIRFRHPAAHGKPIVDPGACSGCGACVAYCPAGAITLLPRRQYEPRIGAA
ncbi:MAG: ferredoxin-type protein NapF [Alphaproteobacteria bacterium]|jgi:ferredoxin-type protein NapF|nr:ferredoxin-type protein NapF [Alphaproteobacteria bacterium]MDP6832478.1 ferredoxin-type protein NapF [Alphaproteobacteria bacterium]